MDQGGKTVIEPVEIEGQALILREQGSGTGGSGKSFAEA
jgi:hypothetical protein